MTYLLLLCTILSGGMVFWIASILVYSKIKSSAAKKGVKTDYYPTQKKVAGVSAFTLFLLCFLSFGVSSLYVQSSGFGLTPQESFRVYARAIGVNASSYAEVDAGNVVFFVSKEDNGQDNWLAYQKKGLFYSRSYGLPSYYYYGTTAEDGSYAGLVATLAEVKTDKGYFYFVGTYADGLNRNSQTESVVFNGKNISLTQGKMFSSTERLSTFALEDGVTLNKI